MEKKTSICPTTHKPCEQHELQCNTTCWLTQNHPNFTEQQIGVWAVETPDSVPCATATIINGRIVDASETILQLKKEINKLIIEKAALFGFLDAVIEEVSSLKKRVAYREKIATYKLVKPIGFTDELPY